MKNAITTSAPILEAIFYGRFSSAAQGGDDSDSETRQRRGFNDVLVRYASRLRPSPSYPLGFFDEAKSAFHGKNISEGFLGEIIEKASRGELANCCLVVDEISRFSRLDPDLATDLISKVVRAGVPIIVNSPDMLIDVDFIRSTNWLILQFAITQAADKSRTISRNVKSKFKSKREKEDRYGKCPSWCVRVGNEFVETAFATVVKEAVRLAIDGHGARKLQEKLGVPKSIIRILQSRNLLGEKEHKVDGETVKVIKGYYPALCSEGDFARLQASIAQRVKFTGKSKSGKSSRNPSANLFTELVTNTDGFPLVMRQRASGNAQRVLRRFTGHGKGLVYNVFETAILRYLVLKQAKPRRIF